MSHERVWIERPLDLFGSISLLPKKDSDFRQRLNTLTRLLIVVCIVLAVVKWKYWYVVLIAGLLVIFHAYLTVEDCDVSHEVNSGTRFESQKKKLFTTKDNMEERPVESYYTTVRIPVEPSVVSLSTVVASESKQPPPSERITIKTRMVKPVNTVSKIQVSKVQAEPVLRLKGQRRTGPKLETKSAKAEASDLMKTVFQELDDSRQADIDSQNMSKLLL